MKNKFMIRTVALKLLEKLYLESDYQFKATINSFEFINENISKQTIQKAGKYLSDKKLIQTDEYASDKWTATIQYTGIDWLEDCHNINPCN